jgi:SAM-dependent methyltransferase
LSGSHYVGSELDVFALARNWKAYFGAALKAHLHGVVLEVGAGLGTTTAALCDGSQRLWLCLEPDLGLLSRARHEIALPSCCRLVSGLSTAVSARNGTDGAVDAVLYIDVLEHIEDDRAELRRALSLLAPGGHLLVVSPAHPFLFMPFDEAVGHFRRYQRHTLRAAFPRASRRFVCATSTARASACSRTGCSSASRTLETPDPVLGPRAHSPVALRGSPAGLRLREVGPRDLPKTVGGFSRDRIQ